MAEQGAGASTDRLDSWKEIAAYLRRGARTVQRWEREEGLPVHRLKHDKLGSVYAYKMELDAWWAGRRADLESEAPVPQDSAASIAVLPFADMSAEKDQAYFCEGMAEEIIGALGRLAGLRVASRTSAFRFNSGRADVAEVGRRLHVHNLLEGSIRKSGERVRVSVKLVNAGSGFQLWSSSYDRSMRDIFAVQEEIANSVAQALEITLSPKERAALRPPPTRNLDAYDCYLRGRKFYYGYGPRDMEFAIQLFTRAITLDPDYALAFAGLADCWSFLYLYSERSDAVRDQADWASTRAVELDPASAQAHASRGVALSLSGRNAEAEEAFDTAIRLDPNLFEAHYFYARHAFARGQAEKAVRHYEEAMRVRPEDYQSRLLVCQSYEDLGRHQDARAARERGVEAAEQHLSLNPDDVRALYMGANGMAALGHGEQARQWAERALALRPEDGMVLYNVGCVYALLDSAEEALTCLERAVRNGISQKEWFDHDSNLHRLRGHSRFRELLRRLE